MTTSTTTSLLGYQAALEEAAYYVHPNAGYIRIGGKDRVDFLQRQTTNDMGLLKEGRALRNVLTSPKARILDVLQLLEDTQAIGAITLPGYNQATTKFLKSKIFFMDQVEVEDVSEGVVVVDLEGPEAGIVLQGLGLTNEWVQDQVEKIEVGGIQVRVIAQKGLTAELGFRLLLPVDGLDDLTERLNEAEATKMDGDSYEILRVEAGIPKAGNELNQDYTPLETNLNDAVSDNKGCYTGQEVIARQITYDKVIKQLVQLKLEDRVEIGADVLVSGKKAGVVTSAANSPRMGSIALAVLKRPHNEEGTIIEVKGHEGQIRGIVNRLAG